tara:strand:- start:12567 stop:12923 length:357 start_codon:yes stop_codon:yes gene_type:complete
MIRKSLIALSVNTAVRSSGSMVPSYNLIKSFYPDFGENHEVGTSVRGFANRWLSGGLKRDELTITAAHTQPSESRIMFGTRMGYNKAQMDYLRGLARASMLRTSPTLGIDINLPTSIY